MLVHGILCVLIWSSARRLVGSGSRQRDVVSAAIALHMPDLVVRHGPFAGMRYPELRSIGGPVFPRLLGSYECELAALIVEACRQRYSYVVNVGCGEGYYAVGLARRLRETMIHAFDTNAEALMLCRRMARLNGVGDRIATSLFCDARRLLSLPLGQRAFILSDCEGYESTLFSAEVVRLLARHDVLIEVHDFLNAAISSTIRSAFAATHTLTCIPSLPDGAKALTYDYPELADYDLATRQRLLSERRPATMEWFMFRARLSG